MTNADRRQKRGGRQTRAGWMEEVKAAFRKGHKEGFWGEHELDLGLNYLLAQGRLTVASAPRVAVLELRTVLHPGRGVLT